MREMIRATTEERLLGNQETLFSPMKNSRNALDSTNHTLVSTRSLKLKDGLSLSLRKMPPTKLKLKRRPRSPKLKLLRKPKSPPKLRPKPKLKREPRKLKSQRNNSKMSSSISLKKLFQNLNNLSK